LFEGRKFQIANGKIAFINGQNDDPYVDLTLKLEESDITIFIGAKGPSSAPKLSFWSMPALGEREIMSYLIFGIDDGFGMGKSQVKSDYTAKAIGALSNMLSKDISNELGIKLDKIEISPSEYQKEGKTVNTTKVEIGKKVSKNLTIIYKNDVESGVGLQYRLNKNVGIETETRTKGNSIDLFYKQDY
jgi:translocation and assembly module TamB